MLIQRLSDQEIVAITKYQLLWAELEEQPSKDIALKYMSSKQYALASQYLHAIQTQVERDVCTVKKKRNTNKIRYEKIKASMEFQTTERQQTDDIQTEQIRLDKIREDKSNITPQSPLEKNQEENFEEFWKYYTPVKGKDGHFVAKGSKKDCRKKYINLLKEGVKHETIITNLEKYLRYCQNNGYSSCGAEVYLNQRRFENDYSGIGCVDSKARDIQRGSVNYAKIAAELARESPYDDKDCVPF